MDVFLSISTSCASIPEGIEFLRHSAEQTEKEAEIDFFDTAYGRVLRRQISDFATYLCEVFQRCCDYIGQNPDYQRAYGESFGYLLSLALGLKEASQKSGAYEAIGAMLSEYKLPTLGRLKKDTEVTDQLVLFKELRTSLDKKIKDFMTPFSNCCICIHSYNSCFWNFFC